MKAFNNNMHTDMKSINDNITAILAALIHKNDNQNKQDDKTTEPSSRLSNYEYCL